MYNVPRISPKKYFIFCLSFLITPTLYPYFDGVSLFSSHSSSSPNNNASSCPYNHGYNSATVINNVEIKETDQLSAQWLLEKSLEGPIEELHIVKKNRGYYEQLLKNHLYKLYQKRATQSGFTGKTFISSACLTGFFLVFTGAVSCPITSDLIAEHYSADPYPFALIPALIAMVGPLGVSTGLYNCYQAIAHYHDRIDNRIAQYEHLLKRVQAMA